MNVLALVKENGRYIFFYDDNSSRELLQQLGKYAVDTELSFAWYDAAILSQKVRERNRKKEMESVEIQRKTLLENL